MYFGLAKMVFESTTDRTLDRKELAALAEKLRAKFRILAKVDDTGFDKGSPTLVLSFLHPSKDKLSQLMDDIAVVCENEGLGRLADEVAMIEHLDYYFE